MGAPQAVIDTCMADALAGAGGVREALLGAQAQARARGDLHMAGQAATLLVLHTLAEYADFRGLVPALADFAAAETALQAAGGVHALRADAVRLGRPALDHRYSADDAALAPVRERLFHGLRHDSGLPADERLLLAKVMVDHDGLTNDMDAVVHVLALMQDVVPQASPRWQAIWWQQLALNHEWRGETDLARAALQRMQAQVAQAHSPELQMALACEEIRQALHTDDRPRAERAHRVIDQCRPHVRPAVLPRGLRAQCALLLRRGEFQAVLAHTRLMLALCEDHEVPERDRAGYLEQRAHALTGLGRHAEAVALLEGLRPSQHAGQGQVLEAIIAMAQAVQAGAADAADFPTRALAALDLAAPIGFSRFLMSFPAWAARIAAVGLDAGAHTEFLQHAIRERRLPPPEPQREAWPWALQVRVLGRLQLQRQGARLVGEAGKSQKKPLELLALLAAHPGGLDAETLIDALWPSLDAEAPRSSLEMAISRLRKALDLPEAVRVAEGRVALNPALVWSDVAAFDAAVHAGDAERALLLYRGPLLQGERLDGLLLQARARLAAQLAAAVLQAATVLRREGRPDEALALLGRGLAAEPQASALQAALRG